MYHKINRERERRTDNNRITRKLEYIKSINEVIQEKWKKLFRDFSN